MTSGSLVTSDRSILYVEQKHCWNDEEVSGDDLLGIVLQECLPALLGRQWRFLEDVSHRGGNPRVKSRFSPALHECEKHQSGLSLAICSIRLT